MKYTYGTEVVGLHQTKIVHIGHTPQQKSTQAMKKYNTRHWGIAPIIGLGFWKDVYADEELPITGYTYNIILPFIRIQIGEITFKQGYDG